MIAALLFVPVFMKSRTNREIPDLAAFRVSTNGNVSVKVSGDVLHEGVYELPANSMAVGVIKLAVPVRPLKQGENGVPRKPLVHGSAVVLQIGPDGSYLSTLGKMSVAERMLLKIPLEISEMTEDDFERLPGIGPGLAQRIMKYRQKNGGILRVEELLEIDGIGEKKFKQISRFF